VEAEDLVTLFPNGVAVRKTADFANGADEGGEGILQVALYSSAQFRVIRGSFIRSPRHLAMALQDLVVQVY
jgi:hypothetical protein